MEKKEKPFSENEKELLVKGNYSVLADKYGCARAYVKMIADGNRKVNSKLSKLIMKDLVDLLKTLSPIDINKNK